MASLKNIKEYKEDMTAEEVHKYITETTQFSEELRALRSLKVEIDNVKEDIKKYIQGKNYSKKAKEKAALINKECDEMVEWGRVKLKQSRTMTSEQKTQLYKEIDNKKRRLKKISKSIELKEKIK